MKRIIAIAFALALGSAFAAGGLVRGAAAMAGMMLGGAHYWGLCLYATDTIGGTVAMEAVGSAPTVYLDYSYNGTSWLPFEVGATTVTVTRVGSGGTSSVYFRARVPYANTALATSDSAYNRFVITGNLAASGSVTSLLRGDAETAKVDTAYAFGHLFYNNATLQTTPRCPDTATATTMSYMFALCTNMRLTEVMPFSQGGQYMFQKCQNLATYLDGRDFPNMVRANYGMFESIGKYNFYSPAAAYEWHFPYMTTVGGVEGLNIKRMYFPNATQWGEWMYYGCVSGVDAGGGDREIEYVYAPKVTNRKCNMLGLQSTYFNNLDLASFKNGVGGYGEYVLKNLFLTNSTMAAYYAYSGTYKTTNWNTRTTLTIWYADGRHNYDGTNWIFTPYDAGQNATDAYRAANP